MTNQPKQEQHQAALSTGAVLGHRTAVAAVYLERYGVSLVFLYLAGTQVYRLLHFTGVEASPVIEVIRQLIWVQLYFYTGILLLIGRRVATPPQKARDILLPLATTFFYLAYYTVPWFPAWLKQSLYPAGWQASCVGAGLLFMLVGLWIAIWAAVHLGRSFGVLIEVRKVVLGGAYRWIRHPMYAGYLCFLAGFALANFSPAYFILIPLHMALLLYRARLEEERLAASSPEYAEYRKRTGFIFPKFRRD